jgi:hypothetical protein
MMLATEVFRQGQDVVDKHLRFLEEEARLHALHHPQMATTNRVRMALRTLSLREYGKPARPMRFRRWWWRPMPGTPR